MIEPGGDEVVKKAFLKEDLIGRLLNLGFCPKIRPLRKIRIKFCLREGGAKIRSLDFAVVREEVWWFLEPVEWPSMELFTQVFFRPSEGALSWLAISWELI